ncbi:acetyl-CoA carboxylase [Halomicrococcus gelatinilyticus]|uniref:acetyl-CoA carboxylase n=1 Tax=Halomicrococcus gelatinilyticus TaxID=1702103 RepID=UPI002E142B8F
MTDTNEVKAPMPGVFYRRPDPDEEPFVEEGDHVEAGDTVGLVEVMKQYNDITTSEAGTVQQFLVDDEEDVAAGDVVVEIAPD